MLRVSLILHSKLARWFYNDNNSKCNTEIGLHFSASHPLKIITTNLYIYLCAVVTDQRAHKEITFSHVAFRLYTAAGKQEGKRSEN